mmetsp:Transcript_41180/g.42081  ORF Transcript_41180/g.42081 Transcript_41180/m.42081 type:complete len:166 (-) Transcript_41180:124-621(-)
MESQTEIERGMKCESDSKQQEDKRGSRVGKESLKSVLRKSGGDFDVMLHRGWRGKRDGGEGSLESLLGRMLAPGGLMFFEDLEPRGWHPGMKGKDAISDQIESWIDQLLVPQRLNYNASEYAQRQRERYPLPATIKWIMCQSHSCVMATCEDINTRRCRPHRFFN